MSTIAKRLGWVIDVCRRCGREAKWPFCAHRDGSFCHHCAKCGRVS